MKPLAKVRFQNKSIRFMVSKRAMHASIYKTFQLCRFSFLTDPLTSFSFRWIFVRWRLVAVGNVGVFASPDDSCCGDCKNNLKTGRHRLKHSLSGSLVPELGECWSNWFGRILANRPRAVCFSLWNALLLGLVCS